MYILQRINYFWKSLPFWLARKLRTQTHTHTHTQTLTLAFSQIVARETGKCFIYRWFAEAKPFSGHYGQVVLARAISRWCLYGKYQFQIEPTFRITTPRIMNTNNTKNPSRISHEMSLSCLLRSRRPRVIEIEMADGGGREMGLCSCNFFRTFRGNRERGFDVSTWFSNNQHASVVAFSELPSNVWDLR